MRVEVELEQPVVPGARNGLLSFWAPDSVVVGDRVLVLVGLARRWAIVRAITPDDDGRRLPSIRASEPRSGTANE